MVGTLTLAAGLGSVGVATSAAAQGTSETFEFTGDAQSYSVPEGVCQVTVDAFGAAGGLGVNGFSEIPGLGGRATASIAVTPGETLLVLVGGEGAQGVNNAAAAGGFNGGGAGGNAANGGGGGGGASDVRQGGAELANRVVVAGGGGGGGAAPNFLPTIGAGGDGGGVAGDDGGTGGASITGGGGGTQAGGGTPGDGTPDGSPGSAGTGGAGAVGSPSTGGGGGGGLFGGGGGGADPNNFGGGGGGGGSGFGPAGVAFETGVRPGDGQVVITVDPGAECPPPVAPAVPAALLVEPSFTG